MPVDLSLHTVSTDQDPIVADRHNVTDAQGSHQWSWLREKIVASCTIRKTLVVLFLDHVGYEL